MCGGTWWRSGRHGVTRFTDFSRSIGLATNVLTARLQKLVAVGIFEIHESALGNSHEYVLTEKGRDLHTVLAALRQWGQKHLFEDDELVNRVVDARTGRQPKMIALTAEDGRELSPDDIFVVQSRAADPIETAVPIDTPRRREARARAAHQRSGSAT